MCKGSILLRTVVSTGMSNGLRPGWNLRNISRTYVVSPWPCPFWSKSHPYCFWLPPTSRPPHTISVCSRYYQLRNQNVLYITYCACKHMLHMYMITFMTHEYMYMYKYLYMYTVYACTEHTSRIYTCMLEYYQHCQHCHHGCIMNWHLYTSVSYAYVHVHVYAYVEHSCLFVTTVIAEIVNRTRPEWKYDILLNLLPNPDASPWPRPFQSKKHQYIIHLPPTK